MNVTVEISTKAKQNSTQPHISTETSGAAAPARGTLHTPRTFHACLRLEQAELRTGSREMYHFNAKTAKH